jgi:hypothetical protein
LRAEFGYDQLCIVSELANEVRSNKGEYGEYGEDDAVTEQVLSKPVVSQQTKTKSTAATVLACTSIKGGSSHGPAQHAPSQQWSSALVTSRSMGASQFDSCRSNASSH